MRTVQAAATAVSIWFSGEDVPDRAGLLALVRQTLADRGLPPWPDVEAECFAAGGDALIIARPAARRLAFAFPELEALLAGALACPDGPSSLYDAGADGYILTAAPEAASPALRAWGEPAGVTADWEVHAREQGLCLMDGAAISELKHWFSR